MALAPENLPTLRRQIDDKELVDHRDFAAVNSGHGESQLMWRAFYTALGIAAVVLGAEFLVIERVTLILPPEQDTQKFSQKFLPGGFEPIVRSKEFIPPEWAPWTLLSLGAVTVLYANGTASKE